MPKIYGLALHTSSRDLGLAMSDFQQDSRLSHWDLDHDLSNYLHLYLAEFIAPQTWEDLAFLAVAHGPGSFTSIRLGLVTARILAQQLNIPLFSISSLAIFAHAQIGKLSGYLALEMPASQGKVYGGIYHLNAELGNPEIYLSDQLFSTAEWQTTLTTLSFDYHHLETPNHLGHTVPSLLQLAHRQWQLGKTPSWSDALPFYG
jgi:tRNA threonylcarbamoyl adenosine modification protein YeaZ